VSNLKFSVVLEAVTAAFNKAVKDSKDNYTSTTTSIVNDSNKMARTTEAVGAALDKVFTATDAKGVTTALQGATKELNNTKQGATLTGQELGKIGQAAKQSVGILNGELKTAQAELKLLAASKATPADLDAAKAKVTALKTEVANAQAEFGRFQTAASTAMRRAAADTDTATASAKKAGSAIYETLNMKSGGSLKSEIAAITTQLATFQANAKAPAEELQRVTTAAKARIAELRGEMGGIKPAADNAATSLASIGKAAIGFAGITAGFAAIKEGIQAVVDTTIKFEAVMKQLEFATGSAERAGVEFDFVRKVAKDLGLELLSSANSYAKLTSATKGTALEGEATRQVFLGVASAAASLGLSVDDTNGVMLAIAQIASKGVVSMEELRQQLGERLPPAMAIAAKSMGVTVAELGKLVENGLDSVTFLKAFGPAMVEAFGPTASKNAQSLQGSINNLKNTFSELLINLGKGGIGQGVATVLQDVAMGVGTIQLAVNNLDPSTVDAVKLVFEQLYGVITTTFGGLMSAIADAARVLDTLADGVVGIVGAFTGIDTASDKVSFLTRVLQGVGIILGTIQDGISALSIAFTVVAGISQQWIGGLALALSKLTFGQLSKDLQQLGTDLQRSATDSFKKAEDQALSFRSAAVAALDRAAEAGESGSARVGAAATAAAGVTNSAFGKVGSDVKMTFQQIEAAATAAGNIIKLSTVQGAEATLGLAKAGNEVRDVFTNLSKDIGVSLPPSIKTVAQLGAVFGEIAVKSKATAALIAKELPEAIGKLNGPELQQFQTAFIGGLTKAGASAEYVQKALLDIASAGAKALGVDLTASLTRTSQAFNDNRVTLDAFVKDFDRLKASGVNASLLIQQSLEAMLAKANNPAELNALIASFQQLGKEGKISGDAMTEGITKAKAKLDELTPGINSLAEAFKTFGMKSREEATATAAKYQEAFKVMKDSGQSTTAELRTAFTTYAQAAVDANKGVASGFLQGQAAAQGLSVKVDETGKVIVDKIGGTAVAAHGKLDTAVAGTSQSYNDLGTAATRAADAIIAAAEAQVAAQQRINKLKEDQKALEDKRLGRDAKGFSTDTTGQTVSAVQETWMSILNTLKGYGVDDDAMARKIASEFTDSKGNVQYFNNPGQKKYGNSETLSLAVQRAAQEYLMKNPPSSGGAAATGQAVGASGSSTNAVTITFKNAAGQAASVTTAPGSSVEDVINVLRQSGATAITKK